MGRSGAAVASYRKVLAIVDGLAAADSANALLQSHLAETLIELSGLLEKTGRRAEARPMRARGMLLLKQQADRPQATPADMTMYANALLQYTNDAHSASEAVTYARKAIAATSSADPRRLDTLARAEQNLKRFKQ